MRTVSLVCALLIGLVACGDKVEDETGAPADSGVDGGSDSGGGTGGGGGDTGGAAAGCASLDVTTCAGREDCRVIDGRAMQDDGAGGICVDFSASPVALGCDVADMGCGAAETLAASPDDPSTCWWFPSTCVPAGWGGCASSEYGECAR